MSTSREQLNLRVPKGWTTLLKEMAEVEGYGCRKGICGGYSAMIRTLLAKTYNLPLPERDFKSEQEKKEQ